MDSQFLRVVQILKDGMAIGLHIGAVVYVRQRGRVVADFAVGAASINPVRELRPDQRLLWLSAGKPVTALAVGILSDRGQVSFDSPVCEFIPNFSSHGKQAITLRHLLTQTHAYHPPRIDWPRMQRDEVITQICDARMIEGAIPGEYAAYDPQTGWYLLSEVVARVSGKPNHEFVEDEIFRPLGCGKCSIGMEPVEWTAELDKEDLAVLHDTVGSARERVDLRAAARVAENDADDGAPGSEPGAAVGTCPLPWAGDDALRAAAHNPAGGALGPAGELATVYECLLQGGITGEGRALLRSSTVEEMTSRQRIGMKDHSFGQIVDWGLGFLINSARYGQLADPYGYGRFASDNTFGHGGMQSSAGFADPDNELAVAVIFNGLPGEPKHNKRVNDVLTALYRDLGLDDGA